MRPSPHANTLRAELRSTRRRLKIAMGALDASHEGMKSWNAELRSLNEELQSANDELDRARKELLSVGNELHAVRSELTDRIERLDRAGHDLRNLIESTQATTIFVDRDGRIRSVASDADGVLGLGESDLGRPLADLAPRIGCSPADIAQALRSPAPAEKEVHPPGTRAALLMKILPYRTAAGTVDGATATFLDVTARRQAEERQRLLLAELNHRVRNTLATVLAIANQTIEDAGSLAAFRRSFTGRIRTMSEIQGLLTRSNWAGVTLRDVLQAEAAPHIKHGSARLALEGPTLVLAPRAALTLALIAHELMTNAVTHGALSLPAGKVSVRWSVADGRGDRRAILEWKESGGPKIGKPKRRGFGRRLVEDGLAYELGGRAELRFESSGFSCRIELPAADTLADEHAGFSF